MASGPRRGGDARTDRGEAVAVHFHNAFVVVYVLLYHDFDMLLHGSTLDSSSLSPSLPR